MKSIVYTSTAKIPVDITVIRDILNISIRNNEESEITGILVYLDGTFLQVLEGPETLINETFDKIKCDARHHNVVVLSEEHIKEREFPKWHMAFRETNQGEAKGLTGYKNLDELKSLCEVETGLAKSLVKSFYNMNKDTSVMFDKDVQA